MPQETATPSAPPKESFIQHLESTVQTELLCLKTEALDLLVKLEHVFGAVDQHITPEHPSYPRLVLAKEQAGKVLSLISGPEVAASPSPSDSITSENSAQSPTTAPVESTPAVSAPEIAAPVGSA